MNSNDTELKKTILLVEDDSSIRELYAMALIKSGFSIIMAENGAKGVELALAEHPDLVLLDIDMPLLNGYEAAAQIRADVWGKTVPLMFLTNHSEPSYEAHAAAQAPEHYLVKAETPMKEVMEIIKSALAS